MVRILDSVDQRFESLLRRDDDDHATRPVAVVWVRRATVSREIHDAVAVEAGDQRVMLMAAGIPADDIVEVRLVGVGAHDPRYVKLVTELCAAICAGQVRALAAASAPRITRDETMAHALINACSTAQCTLMLGGVPVPIRQIAELPVAPLRVPAEFRSGRRARMR